jgi:hypothetical protein
MPILNHHDYTFLINLLEKELSSLGSGKKIGPTILLGKMYELRRLCHKKTSMMRHEPEKEG